MANEEKTIAKSAPQHPAVRVKEWLNQRSDALAEWCSDGIDPLTLIRVGSRLVAKQSQFQDSKTWPSLYMALITAAQLGLEPDGPRGEAYLIPYWDRGAKCNFVQLMPGYRGIMKLITSSGEVKSIRSQVVFANDDFSMDLMDPDDPDKNYHCVSVGDDRGEAVGVYSRVVYSDGSHDNEFAGWSEVMKAKSSANGKSPAWEMWPEQMARKFIIKRHSNQLPLDSAARQAIDVDNISSDSAAADVRAVIDEDGKLGSAAPAALPESGLAAKLAAKAESRKKVEPVSSKSIPKRNAKAAAKKKAAAATSKEPTPIEHPEPPPVDEPQPGDDFLQCELCGEQSNGELCDPCAESVD